LPVSSSGGVSARKPGADPARKVGSSATPRPAVTSARAYLERIHARTHVRDALRAEGLVK